MFNLTKRFSIGINIDDSWRYAGARVPKSILIPHLLSMDLPGVRIVDKINEMRLLKHGHSNGKFCRVCDRAVVALAEELKEAEITFVRCWFPWSFFEPRLVAEARLLEESYQEWPMDDFVNILNENSISVVPVVACGYDRMLPANLKVDSNRELYVRRAAIHVRLLVRRYRRKIRFWQIENEPNWWRMHAIGGWRSGFSWIEPNGFRTQLLKELNDAVHAEEPRAQTIINLEADHNVSASRFAPFCDIIGLDFYPNYRSSSPIDTSIFLRAQQISREADKPVIISETGYPSGPSLLGYSPVKQAEYVMKACSEASKIETLTAIGIWRCNDTAWRSFPFQENHFGLIDMFGNPKPAWKALSEITSKLS